MLTILFSFIVLFIIGMQFKWFKYDFIYKHFIYIPSIKLYPLLMSMGCHKIKSFPTNYDIFWRRIAYAFLSNNTKKQKNFEHFKMFCKHERKLNEK